MPVTSPYSSTTSASDCCSSRKISSSFSAWVDSDTNSGGRRFDENVFRRARLIAATRYALSPQPRAPEDALYEAMHARASLQAAMAEAWKQLHQRTPSGTYPAVE